MNHALKTRDVLDFVQIRWANETDDFEIGDLFANAFIEYEEENFLNYWSREAKLTRIRDLEHVRDEGHVMVMELGYRIIGALTLFKPHAMYSFFLVGLVTQEFSSWFLRSLRAAVG